MVMNPVETLNVFDQKLSEELRNRASSVNLVRTRAPFIRFTTGADLGDLSTKMTQLSRDLSDSVSFSFDTGKLAEQYRGYEFFTLGLHGYDDREYSADLMYGTKGDQGLVVGITYKQGEQKLVRTIKTSPTLSAKNYAPPGITTAKVERVRNGNVLRYTIETQCYTQEQLEMLDMLCYVPGMTCMLEWGSSFMTPNQSGGLKKENILNFTDISGAKRYINDAIRGSRSAFIQKWCEPNNFNYDWAVANIANVKTRLENNVYKTTIIAYGRADNLMYISAYATNNPLTQSKLTDSRNPNVYLTKSVQSYFAPGGAFINRLRNAVTQTTGQVSPLDKAFDKKLIRFNNPALDSNKDVMPGSTQTRSLNDVGFEDTYFLTFDVFVQEILNRDLISIINDGVEDGKKYTRLLHPLKPSRILGTVTSPNEEDVIYVGWNERLRSTAPDVMIIYNPTAIGLANSNREPIRAGLLNNLTRDPDGPGGDNQAAVRTTDFLERDRIPASLNSIGAVRTDFGVVGNALIANQFNNLSAPTGGEVNPPSGIGALANGVWLNSKNIQQCFINARTIMEGLETLFNKINAATENYWDLSLFYDDDVQSFRCVDNNLKNPDIPVNKPIYEFNKKLNSLQDNTVIGPDVLSIDIDSDYPKILFSQLAISGINGGSLISNQKRGDFDLKIQRSVRDIFATGPAIVSTVGVTVSSAEGNENLPAESRNPSAIPTQRADAAADRFFTSITGLEFPERKADFLNNVRRQLGNLQREETGVLQAVNDAIVQIFASQQPLSPTQAQGILLKLSTDLKTQNVQLNSTQIEGIKKLIALRILTITSRIKKIEINKILSLESSNLLGPDIKRKLFNVGKDGASVIINSIQKDANTKVNEIFRQLGGLKVFTQEEIDAGKGPVFQIGKSVIFEPGRYVGIEL